MTERRKESRTYRASNFSCRVESELPGQHRALELFIPGADRDDLDADWEIKVTVDPERFHQLLLRADSSSPVEELEVFKGETILLRYSLDDSTDLFIERGGGSEHVVLKRQRIITVVLANPEPKMATYAVRALRELTLRAVEECDGIMMHAAAVTSDNRAALLVGAKGAGKTTVMLAACLAAGAGYVGNDRAAVVPHQRGFDIQAFPMVCRIHPGTAGHFPDIAALMLDPRPLARVQCPLFSSRHGSMAALLKSATPDTKLELAPAEIREFLRVNLVDAAPLGCVVFPQISGTASGVSLSSLPPGQAVGMLRAQCMTPTEEKWITPWLIRRSRSKREMEHSVQANIELLANSVPCVVLNYGFGHSDVYEAGKAVVELIRSSL